MSEFDVTRIANNLEPLDNIKSMKDSKESEGKTEKLRTEEQEQQADPALLAEAEQKDAKAVLDTFKKDQGFLSDAEGELDRILDADEANKVVEETKQQIVENIPTSMLAQANLRPQKLLVLYK